MAPELALKTLGSLKRPSVVLDPMVGSGTVVRHAIEGGHKAIGFDMDPLAVLMSKVWTTSIDVAEVQDVYDRVLRRALELDPTEVSLPWIDDNSPTSSFIEFWFGPEQSSALRCIAFAIHEFEINESINRDRDGLDIVKLALSRIIITKDNGASLARDASHSRPHKVADLSSYNVFDGLHRSFKALLKKIKTFTVPNAADIRVGDARKIALKNSSVDLILTSPPYLNAIDYMRGHRLSLVWLGYSLDKLRIVRSDSIGAEKMSSELSPSRSALRNCAGSIELLENRQQRMIDRYIEDALTLMSEIARVLRESGTATLVVGNSCLKGVFIKNADIIALAGEISGLNQTYRFERELPSANRYLPTPTDGALGKRMRTESIISFAH